MIYRAKIELDDYAILLPIFIPDLDEVRAFANQLHTRNKEWTGEALGWDAVYNPASPEPPPDSKMTFTPADFSIGDGAIMYHQLYRVTAFEFVQDYTLRVHFDDGSEQVIDLEPILYGEMYGPLRDREMFHQVSIDPIARTLTWANGADFDPETLRNWDRYKVELKNAQNARHQVLSLHDSTDYRFDA